MASPSTQMLGMDDGFKRGEFIASSQAAQCALLVQLPGRGPERGGSGPVDDSHFSHLFGIRLEK